MEVRAKGKGRQMTKQEQAYQFALAEIGVREWSQPGKHNPTIVGYFADAGWQSIKDDETAWCAAFVGAMLARAGLSPSGKLTARSYLTWGEPVPGSAAREGDVIVLSRGDPKGWQGHVGFLRGWADDGDPLVLGGNQRNAVSVAAYPKERILGFVHWPESVPAQPPLWNGLTWGWLINLFGRK
jgi:uncharacterized protein (TIGR02594 family)